MKLLIPISLLLLCGCASNRPIPVAVAPQAMASQSAVVNSGKSVSAGPQIHIQQGSIKDLGYDECDCLPPATGAIRLIANQPGQLESSTDLINWKPLGDYQCGTWIVAMRSPNQFFRLKTP